MSQEDYLEQDPELRDQKYVCVSILTNSSIKDNDGNVIKTDNTARGIKIRGVYSTMEQAQKRCEEIRSFDPLFNIYVGEIGKWLSWDDDMDKAEDAVYAEPKLNSLMKNYKDQQVKAKEYQETRKKTDLENSKKLVAEEKQRRLETVPQIKECESENVVDATSSQEIPSNVKELEEQVVKTKEGLSDYKADINDKKKNVNSISEELEKARKLFEEIQKKKEKK